LATLGNLSGGVNRQLIAGLNAAEIGLNSGQANKVTAQLYVFII